MLISVHFPKAAGTTFGHNLRLHFGDTLLEDYGDRIGNPISQRLTDPYGYFLRTPEIPANTRCIHGHFHPHKYASVSGAQFCTFLRHPMSWIFSLYAHWMTVPRDGYFLQDYVLDNKLDVVRVARLPVIRRELSEVYFGGVDFDTFDFIGFYETREEDLDLFSSQFGVPMPTNTYERRTRPNAARDQFAADPDVRSALREVLADDIALYERVFFQRKGRHSQQHFHPVTPV